MTTIATICARGGSQGLPGKNIKLLHGKPLIVHTIEQALACDAINDVFVSTDDHIIAKISVEAGAKVPFLRPSELATSTTPKLPVIIHLVDHLIELGYSIDTIVDLDPTSPLRIISDIRSCIDLLDDRTDAVITAYPSDKNPYFNMVEYKQDGSIKPVKALSSQFFTRQSSPSVFSMNASIYVWKLHTLKLGLWSGRTRMYVMPRERSIDIDSEFDFNIVEFLMSNNI